MTAPARRSPALAVALLLFAALLCGLDSVDAVKRLHRLAMPVVIAIDLCGLAIFLVAFARGSGRLASGARGSASGIAGSLLLLAPLPLFAGYHLLVRNWAVIICYAIVGALQQLIKQGAAAG